VIIQIFISKTQYCFWTV